MQKYCCRGSVKNLDDLNAKLAEILQDPGRIQQIMEIASSMGLGTADFGEQADVPAAASEAIAQVSQVLHQTEAKEKKQQTLVRALLPYLSPGRQARLERAMQISHLSRLAGAALRNNPISAFTGGEEEPHV